MKLFVLTALFLILLLDTSLERRTHKLMFHKAKDLTPEQKKEKAKNTNLYVQYADGGNQDDLKRKIVFKRVVEGFYDNGRQHLYPACAVRKDGGMIPDRKKIEKLNAIGSIEEFKKELISLIKPGECDITFLSSKSNPITPAPFDYIPTTTIRSSANIKISVTVKGEKLEMKELSSTESKDCKIKGTLANPSKLSVLEELSFVSVSPDKTFCIDYTKGVKGNYEGHKGDEGYSFNLYSGKESLRILVPYGEGNNQFMEPVERIMNQFKDAL